MTRTEFRTFYCQLRANVPYSPMPDLSVIQAFRKLWWSADMLAHWETMARIHGSRAAREMRSAQCPRSAR